MSFKVTGLREATKGFTELKREIKDAAGETADKSADVLYTASQKEVPRETGALAESGRKDVIRDSGPRRTTGIKYGYPGEDSAVDYAAAVHEILKASHKAPTKAKYVEDPLVQNIGEYKSISVMACESAVRRAF